MNYCIIRGSRIIFTSKNTTEEYVFTPGGQTKTAAAEHDQKCLALSVMRNLENGEYKAFLQGHIEKFCKENGAKIHFMLDCPWVDMRLFNLPPHKKNKTRQILALNLSNEFIYEIENIIFDFYLLPKSDTKNTTTIIYACNKLLSEIINNICVSVSALNQGILPYSHLIETMFSSRNPSLLNHVHIHLGKDYTLFYAYRDGQFTHHLQLDMTENHVVNFKRIKDRLRIIMSDIPGDVEVTLDEANSHLYPYIESESESHEFSGEINETINAQQLDAWVAQTRKKRRLLNLTRIQNPFLLDILRARRDFIKVAIVFCVIMVGYIGLQGMFYYLNKNQLTELNAIVLRNVKKISPDARSVSAAVNSLSKRRDDFYARWENRQEFSYRSYKVTDFLNTLEDIRSEIKGLQFGIMRYEDGYIELSGTVDSLSEITALQTANEQKFTNYDANIEEKNIGGKITFTLKLTKKTQEDSGNNS